MSAPRSVKLDKDVLLVVNDDFLVVAANDDGDRSLLGLGDGLGLDARLDLSVKDVLDELANLLDLELLGLVVRVLGVLGGFLDSEGGELLGLKVEIAGVGTKQLGIEGDNVDGTTVLLSNGTELVGELLTLLGSLGEDVSQRNTGLIIVKG